MAYIVAIGTDGDGDAFLYHSYLRPELVRRGERLEDWLSNQIGSYDFNYQVFDRKPAAFK